MERRDGRLADLLWATHPSSAGRGCGPRVMGDTGSIVDKGCGWRLKDTRSCPDLWGARCVSLPSLRQDKKSRARSVEGRRQKADWSGDTRDQPRSGTQIVGDCCHLGRLLGSQPIVVPRDSKR